MLIKARRLLAWILVAACVSAPAQVAGPGNADTPIIRANSRVVQIDVTAKDEKGHALSGLSAADFHVTDDGKPREIRFFTSGGEKSAPAPRRPAALPEGFFSNELPPAVRPRRATVILMDGINTLFESQSFARQRAMAMLDHLSDADPIAVYAMSPNLKILHDYTTDHAQLKQGIRAFRPVAPLLPVQVPRSKIPMAMEGLAAGQARAVMEGRVRDTIAMLRGVGEHMAMLPGRKAILWITAGFPPSALNRLGNFKEQFDKAVAALNEANVAIYPVDARGLVAEAGPRKDIKISPTRDMFSIPGFGPPPMEQESTIDTMKEFADATGGEAFYDRNDIDTAMEEAIADAHTNYTMGFYLPDAEADGKIHQLHMHINTPGASLQYRQSYFAGGQGTLDAEQKNIDLESATLSPLDETAVIVAARLGLTGSGSDRTANLTIYLEPRTISLKDKDGRITGEVDEMFVESDRQGKVMGKISDHVQFDVPPEKRAAYNRTGPSYVKSMHVPAGATKIRVIVRDNATGHVGSLTIPLSSATEPPGPSPTPGQQL